MKINMYIKHGYSEHFYNEFMYTMYIMNYDYNESKLFVPSTSKNVLL